jgi:hypothetical protein
VAAHDHRERQHHQRGDRADDQPGAYAFQREIEHVLTYFVGAEDVIGSGKIGDGADERGEQQSSYQHSPESFISRHSREGGNPVIQ